MATEHDGNQVTPHPDSLTAQPPCEHGFMVYEREGHLIHVGSGVPCVPNETADPPTVIHHWQPEGTNPMQDIAEATHGFIGEKLSQLATGQPVAPQGYEPLFGINDDNGRSLLEFRVRDGYIETKYYPSDLDEATHRFINYLMSIQQQQQG